MAESTVHDFEVPGHAALRVEIPGGRVTVETGADARVEVEVAPARGDERSAQAAAETTVTASERGGGHEIAVRAPKRTGRLGIGLGRGPELAVSIRCPQGSDLEHVTHSADLECRGTLGAVSVRSASGDASLEDTASLAFATASGDLAAGAVAGPLAAKSASGDIDVRSVGGHASVNTVSGDVRVDATEGEIAVQTVSGDVALRAAGAGVRIGTVSGDVEVSMVPGLVLHIDAQSVSGTMSSELELGDDPGDGAGETVELRVRTVSGDVRVARSAIAAR